MLIIHGDNQSASRNLFLEIKNQKLSSGDQIIELSGRDITLTEIRNKLEASSLFGNKNCLFITDLFTAHSFREKSLIIDYLLSAVGENIYIWESRDVFPQLRKFPPDSVRKFELPRYIFQFLDNMTLPLLHRALGNTPPEQLFALLVGHFHKLILIKDNAGSFPLWQKQKLLQQASGYKIDHLKDAYAKLLELDYRHKTSASSQSLPFSLELWLSRL